MAIESDRFARPGVSPYDALPGLAQALDEETMRRHVAAALFRPGGGWTVERCTPTRPLYVPGESCLVRYRFRARRGAALEPTVIGRVFPDGEAAGRYFDERLAPLVARTQGRPEVAAFATPAALIEPLHAVVHVWPVDGELPTLVDATDRTQMVEVLGEELPRSLGDPVEVRDCEVELVSYRRRGRCVLRYRVAGDRERVVYGKVTATGGQALTAAILTALRERIGAGERLTLPRSLGARPELRLSLLEAVPGTALIQPALAAQQPGLEDMVAACGRVAALLHGSGIDGGRARTLDDELAGLRADAGRARHLDPGFGDRAQGWIDRLAARAHGSEPLPPCLNHGDFKHEQVLLDGERTALVDFDGLCRAEPALDLGKFAAHVRYEARRAGHPAALADGLAERFLGAYAGDEPTLRERTGLYEAIALARLALRAHHDLDAARRDRTAGLLEERLSAG